MGRFVNWCFRIDQSLIEALTCEEQRIVMRRMSEKLLDVEEP